MEEFTTTFRIIPNYRLYYQVEAVHDILERLEEELPVLTYVGEEIKYSFLGSYSLQYNISKHYDNSFRDTGYRNHIIKQAHKKGFYEEGAGEPCEDPDVYKTPRYRDIKAGCRLRNSRGHAERKLY